MAALGPNAVTLKLLLDPKSKTLLFAEAGKDFVDFLFGIMSLPVGTVIRLTGKQTTAGCIGNIYNSIENLGDSYMVSAGNSDILLKPQAFNYGVYEPRLLPPYTYTNFYRCSNVYKPKEDCLKYMSNNSNSRCPCGYYMNGDITSLQYNPVKGGGFVKEAATYMITDDLIVRPMSTNAIFTLLNQFNVKDVSDLEEKIIAVGVDEGVELIKASMQDKKVLTSVFLGVKDLSIKSEPN